MRHLGTKKMGEPSVIGASLVPAVQVSANPSALRFYVRDEESDFVKNA